MPSPSWVCDEDPVRPAFLAVWADIPTIGIHAGLGKHSIYQGLQAKIMLLKVETPQSAKEKNSEMSVASSRLRTGLRLHFHQHQNFDSTLLSTCLPRRGYYTPIPIPHQSDDAALFLLVARHYRGCGIRVYTRLICLEPSRCGEDGSLYQLVRCSVRRRRHKRCH